MLSLIIDGFEFSVDDGQYGRLVGYDGWGASPSGRLFSQGPQQHGDTDEGQFLAPRFGSLIFQVPNTELDDMYAARSAFLDLVNPADNIILKWDLPYGVRYFDVVFYDDMKMAWEPSTWASLKFSVVFKASNPICYDPTVNIITFVGATGTAFTIPWVVPTFVGGSTLEDSQSILYKGTWFEYPLVTIVGPATNPIVRNLATDEKLDFTGLALGAGEQRIVDTRYGFKTVVDGSGANKIADLTDDSDLATFHIERKRPYEANRANPIEVTAINIDSGTRITVRWLENYTGI